MVPITLYIIIASVALIGIWFVAVTKKTKQRRRKFQEGKRSVSDNFERNVSEILKHSVNNRQIKPTVTQWLTQYENISALQVRLLQSSSKTPKTESQQNFAHQMIEKQKQQIENNAKELLIALHNKDMRMVRQICDPTLQKKDAVERAMRHQEKEQ